MKNVALFSELVKGTKPSSRAIFFLYLTGESITRLKKITVKDARAYLDDRDYPFNSDISLFDNKAENDLAFSFSNNRELTPSRIRQIIESIIAKTEGGRRYSIEDLKKLIL